MWSRFPNNVRSLVPANFFVSSSIIFAGSFLVNVLNYVFTLIMGRLLGVQAFGEVAALLSLLLVVSVPAAALSMLMTRESAFHNTQGRGAVRELFMLLRRHVFLAALIFWMFFLFSLPLFARLLHLDYVPLLIFSVLIPITLASSLQSGTLQGLQEFFMLSKQSVLGTLIKLVGSSLLVVAGFSVAGVMLGLVLASLGSWAYGYLATRALLAPGEAEETDQSFSLRSVRELFPTILVTTLLLTLLSNVDVLMAKHYLSPELAGQYGALSTIGKVLIYGIGAFIAVLLPMVSAAQAEGRGEGSRILFLSLAIIAAASIGVYALFSLFPTAIVALLLGSRYLAIAPLLGTFSIAMACISLTIALVNYFVATQNTSFIYLLFAGIALEVSLIALNHASLAAMTGMFVVSSLILLALMSANYLVFCRAKSV